MNEKEIREAIKQAVNEPKTPEALLNRTLAMARTADRQWEAERAARNMIPGAMDKDPDAPVLKGEESQPALGGNQDSGPVI